MKWSETWIYFVSSGPEQHRQCPKCHAPMEEYTLSASSGVVMVDRCTDCKGIWFDTGEAEHLKDKEMSDYIDDGDPEFGKQQNRILDINCPRCGAAMSHLDDPL